MPAPHNDIHLQSSEAPVDVNCAATKSTALGRTARWHTAPSKWWRGASVSVAYIFHELMTFELVLKKEDKRKPCKATQCKMEIFCKGHVIVDAHIKCSKYLDYKMGGQT